MIQWSRVQSRTPKWIQMVGCFRFVKLPLKFRLLSDYFISLIWPGYARLLHDTQLLLGCQDAMSAFQRPSSPDPFADEERPSGRSLEGSLTIDHWSLAGACPSTRDWSWSSWTNPSKNPRRRGGGGVCVGGSSESNQGEKDEKGTVNQYQSISIKSINIIQSCFCLSSTPSSINAKGKRHPTLVTPEQLTTGAGLMLQFSQEPGEMDPSSPSKPRQSQAHRCSQGCARCSEWKYEWT